MAERLKYNNDGVPKNWDGKDWYTYKWAMEAVFEEKLLTDIVSGRIKRDKLTTEEGKADYDLKQKQIRRMVGTSVPPEILQQIKDKTSGTDIWAALVDLFENKTNETVKVHTTRRLVNELWSTKLASIGDTNLHLCKLFNIKTELETLKYDVKDIDMVEIMLESLPQQHEFESLKTAVRYSADSGSFTSTKVREMIRSASARQAEFYRGRNSGGGRGGHQKSSGNTGNYSGDKGKAEESADSGSKRVRKCFVCKSTDHVKVNCPERAKKKSDSESKEGEEKRNARGCVTILQSIPAPPNPHSGDEVIGVVTGAIGTLDIGEVNHNEVPEQLVSGELDMDSGWWFFDTAANAHVTGNSADFIAFTEDTSNSQSVHGVTTDFAARVVGVGTVALESDVNGVRTTLVLNDVLYVPGAEFGLISPGRAVEQGLDFEHEGTTHNFNILDEGVIVAIAKPVEATWGFYASNTTGGRPHHTNIANLTAVDGIAPLVVWHKRLAHTCPQYLKTMVDRGLVRGMMLTAKERQSETCDACHLAKQKRKPRWKKLDRGLERPNQVVYSDLLIPSQGNGTRYKAILVIMDGYSRFATTHMLTSKSSGEVGEQLKQYILWAERQAGRNRSDNDRETLKVNQVLTDKGGEFVNAVIDGWYAGRGIEHVKVGPKCSQLNLCERTHQSLVGMTKSMMIQAGFPRSLWPEAMVNAVYLKNRVFNAGIQGIPYEKMFGTKPDLHHIRTFGALAYVHIPVTPGRRKHHDNARVGFVLGYAEDVIGCKVYFPEERTVKFVSDLRVTEEVLYRDRHQVDAEQDTELESLHFEQAPETPITELLSDESMELEREQDVLDDVDAEEDWEVEDDVPDGEDDEDQSVCERRPTRSTCYVKEFDRVVSGDYLMTQNSVASEVGSEIRVGDQAETAVDSAVAAALNELRDESEEYNIVESDGVSVTVQVGSEADGAEDSDHEAGSQPEQSETVDSDVVSVVSGFATEVDGERQVLEDVQPQHEVVDASAILCPKVTGKRTHRDETSSEEARVERSAYKMEPKRKRAGLREADERRRPSYLDEYTVNAMQKTTRVLDANGKPIVASQVKIPKNHHEAMRSKYADFWRLAEMEEMASLKAKGVLKEIPYTDVPEDAKPIRTGWVYALKTDFQGYVIRFKSRTVAFGNHQRSGIGFVETFSPVARMSSFRMLAALAAILKLILYGGDVNTAYLNAWLGIRQYLKGIDGYPCEIAGHMYAVVKALYGLRQSGREWNAELNKWMLEHGYLRSLTEPCLYHRFERDIIMLVLVYVDDILVATDNESTKCKLFDDIDKAYGIKDQGKLKQFLGVAAGLP